MKRKNLSDVLQRTTNKIMGNVVNPAPDSKDRILSATATQCRLALDLQAFARQPSVAGKKRKGYKAPLHQAVDFISSQLGQVDLKSVLQFMEDFEMIEELYGRMKIDINVVEVHRDSRQISYTTRDGKEKTASFKTIGNLITQFKVSKPD